MKYYIVLCVIRANSASLLSIWCYRSSIKEEFYVPHCSPEDMIEISKRIKPDLLDSKEMTRILRGDHPNTYTFTKALAEQAVKENASDLPLSIFRPSIVVAAAKEPMPGWIDNLNGPTGNRILWHF